MCPLAEPDGVAVPTTRRAVPGVEAGRHLADSRHPDIVGKEAVQGSPEFVGGPAIVNLDACGLSPRMHAGICSSGARDPRRPIAKPAQCLLEDALNRPFSRLNLPTGKIAAVVMQHELKGAPRHRKKLSRGDT